MTAGKPVAGIVPTEFIEAMHRHDLNPDPARIVPGVFFRFPGLSGKKSSPSGWGKLFTDCQGGVFGDYATSSRDDWQAKREGEQTPAERNEYRQQVNKAYLEAKANREKARGRAAKEASKIWEEASPAPEDHGYLVKKGIPQAAKVLRLYHGPLILRGMPCEGALIVPAYAEDGQLATLAFIGLDGEKRFLSGGKKGGAMMMLGADPTPEGVICVAEGVATASSIEAATTYPVAVAFDAGNLQAVATIIKKRHPAARLLICADNDHHEDGKVNTGFEAALKAAHEVGGLVACPELMGGVKTDFNDLAQGPGGLERVKVCINAALTGEQKPVSGEGAAPEADSETPEETITRLAGLSPLDYDRLRQVEAERLGVRAVTLDKEVARLRGQDKADERGNAVIFAEIEPWPEPVAGAALLDDLAALFRRFVVLPRHADKALALWCCLTYLVDSVDVLPILNVASPEKRCGKSTLLTVIIRVVNRPLLASNITPSAMFRAIDLWRPTLILDEADTFITSDNEDLRGIINSGHTKDTAFIIRNCGEDHEPRQFSTWAAKAIAGIGHLPGTVRDRSIEIELKRRTSHEPIEKLRLADPEIFETIRRKCFRFAADIRFALSGHRPEIPTVLHDRAADNWWPLLSIAELVGEGWAAIAREAALSLAGAEQEAVSINVELLADIKDIFDFRGVDRIATALLIDALCEDSDRPWATWNKGKPISPHQLSRRLKEFSIAPVTIRLTDGKTPKGYNLHQFNDAFHRYTPFQTATTPQTNNSAGIDGFSNRHKDELWRFENSPKSTAPGVCGGVAFPEGENEECACDGGKKWARL